MNIQPIASNIVLPGVRPHRPTDPTRYANRHRLTYINAIPLTIKNHLVAFLGEFVGTFLFLFFAFAATQVANTTAPGAVPTAGPNTAGLLYIACSFGFSLLVNVWIFFRVTGGMFNPCVALGLALIGAIDWIRAVIVFIAQLVGAIAAAAVVSALLPGDMAVSTTLSPSVSAVRGLFIEMFLTIILIFTILMLAAEKSKTTFLAPVGIGLALFIAHLVGVYFTGTGVNPARSFAPCVVLGSFPAYHWIYWVGPILGTLVSVLFYKLIKGLEYETANPGQDSDGTPAGARDEDVAAPPAIRYDGSDFEMSKVRRRVSAYGQAV